MDAEIGLDLRGPRTRGRAEVAVVVSRGADLTADDLRRLPERRATGRAPAVAELKDSHHALARCLASGMKPHEASAVTGYSPSRVSILQADPAFAELVEFYRAVGAEEFANAKDRMTSLLLDMTTEMRDRLEKTPELVETETVLAAIKVLADRTGNGPITRNLNVNVDLAGRLEAARKRLEAA